MKSDLKFKIMALFLYALMTILHLYPLSLNPASAVHDLGDPLLNTWIISWVQKTIFSQPLKLFDASIFHPHQNTLAFSEHLIPQSIASLPVALLFKNPVLTYNFLFLFSYILAAFGMFLLIRHLSQNNLAALISGAMFAFTTYHLDHIPQLQLLSSGLIPLTFLYLHKFFEEKQLKHGILFALFFALQALSAIYYGLFLISMLIVAIPLLLGMSRRKVNLPFLLKLAAPLFFSFLTLLIFSLPYLSLFKTYGFKRGLHEGASLVNYLGVARRNVFLGDILASFGAPERFLFPGLTAIFFLGLYLISRRKAFWNIPHAARILLLVSLVASLGAMALILLSGGLSFRLGSFHLSAHNPLKPLAVFFSTAFLYVCFSFILFLFDKKDKVLSEIQALYLYLLLFFWALALSLGGSLTIQESASRKISLPFKLLYDFLPGFKGIRQPSRYGLFVIFCTTVLAGLGLSLLLERIKKKKGQVFLAIMVLGFVNLECLTIPQYIKFVPVKEDIPPSYQWLKEQPGDFVIVEHPFLNPIGKESVYMYFSIFHGKKIVNGYSGFIPPATDYIRARFVGFPSKATLEILRTFAVKYVLLRPNLWQDEVKERKMERLERFFEDDLQLIKEFEYTVKRPNDVFESFGKDLIYEVISKEREGFIQDIPAEDVPAEEWEVEASINENQAVYVKDRDIETRWNTGRAKRTGDYLLVRFKQPVELTRVSLYLGKYRSDFAFDFILEASLNGQNWKRIDHAYSAGEFAKNLVDEPLSPVQNITLPHEKLRFLKIIHLGDERKLWWSVAELRLWGQVLLFANCSDH